MGSPVNACDDMVTHWRPCQNPAKRFGSGAAEISVSAAPSRSVGKLVQGILGAHQHCPKLGTAMVCSLEDRQKSFLDI